MLKTLLKLIFLPVKIFLVLFIMAFISTDV